MKKIILYIFTAICSINLLAQQAITSAGNEASGTGGTVSYTVGQVAYTSDTGTNGTVTQGVQQPFEISVITALEEAKDISLEWSVYPNPTRNLLKLILQNSENSGLKIENLSYQLYNIHGKLLQSNKLKDNETSIHMEEFTPETYILKIIQTQGVGSFKEIKTFKIIKY